MTHVSKGYLHNRTALGLLGVNGALLLLTILYILSEVDSGENPTSIVAYRATTKIGSISGATSELYQFALFALIVTVFFVVISIKLYPKRHHIAVAALGLNTLLLIMTILVFYALTRTL